MIHRLVFPHPDDAVLSLGAFMAAEPCVAYSVFAGIPDEFKLLTAYDASCGFATSHQAMRARREEDADACAALGALSHPLDFLDQQYRDGPPDEEAIIEQIRRLVNPRVHLFAPLGIGHPDHQIVARCARAAVSSFANPDFPVELFAVEDLPYRVLWPEQAHDALDTIRGEGWTVESLPYPLAQGDRERKEAALRCYRSQWGPDLDPAFLVPERAWRCTR